MLTLISAGCAKKTIQAGGSTFVHPLMNLWAGEYEKVKGVRIDYHAIGSGEGIRQTIAKSLVFGCTDAPLTDAELQSAKGIGGGILHIPLALGAVVPAYNLEKLQEPLRFTGPVLADIYLGKIKRWNDQALKKLNPDVELPDKEIAVVHRADGSGTTYVWADYLSKVSPEWKAKVGVATTLTWPCGVAESGNAGVVKKIMQTPAALGYIELAYALKEKMSFGLVQNKEGAFIRADMGSVNEAASATVADGDVPE